ncbi:MAG: hypothetical protein OER86_11105, partial [Phycisphaerae bacterium]|nr:hypothetical protein [Phycisphaerae bacterium]
GGPADHYQLAVNVSVERRQQPSTRLNTAAMTSLRPLTTGRAGGGAFWRPLGRDSELEQVLVRAIAERAGLVAASSSGETDGS